MPDEPEFIMDKEAPKLFNYLTTTNNKQKIMDKITSINGIY